MVLVHREPLRHGRSDVYMANLFCLFFAYFQQCACFKTSDLRLRDERPYVVMQLWAAAQNAIAWKLLRKSILGKIRWCFTRFARPTRMSAARCRNDFSGGANDRKQWPIQMKTRKDDFVGAKPGSTHTSFINSFTLDNTLLFKKWPRGETKHCIQKTSIVVRYVLTQQLLVGKLRQAD